MIDHLIPADKSPSYWPGDLVDANTLPSEEYQQITMNRTRRLREFLNSSQFTTCVYLRNSFFGKTPKAVSQKRGNILKCCMSSFPRWAYAQQLSHDPVKRRELFGEDANSGIDEDFEFVWFLGSFAG